MSRQSERQTIYYVVHDPDWETKRKTESCRQVPRGEARWEMETLSINRFDFENSTRPHKRIKKSSEYGVIADLSSGLTSGETEIQLPIVASLP